jgi:AraC-like DNA-binding protein
VAGGQKMTYYQKEITRIKSTCYANKGQIETVISTRHYINNHFDKGLNLALLSRIRFTSKYHLLRLFKRYYGQTPKQYLTDKRIERAKELLAQGVNVTETCFDIGFDSPSSFSTLFKSYVGVTPSEFQKRATFTKSN